MLYFKASVVQWKEIRPWRPDPGLKEALVSGNSNGSCNGRGGARSAPFGVAMCPKRRVRAAHGRAREAKPTSLYLPRVLCLSYSCRPVIFLSVVVAER
jgi:hypothetical protein